MTPIPNELSHLKVDRRGYAVPFFVPYINGEPDFRLLDADKQKRCIDEKLCAICGKKLLKECMFFIGGPLTYANKTCTDPAMHRVCAEYSLAACPHMYYHKAQRRETGIENGTFGDELLSLNKPTIIFLIKARKYKAIPHPTAPGARLIKFSLISEEMYKYENNELKKVIV